MDFHFGIICLPYMGHLNPILSLATEIKARGYKVTLFHYQINNSYFKTLNQLRIKTLAICTKAQGNLIRLEVETLGKLAGWQAHDHKMRLVEKLAEIHLHQAPKKISSVGCDALLIDQGLLEGESIACLLKLPFINICTGLIQNPDLKLPPISTSWQTNLSIWGLLRNCFGYLYLGLRSRNILQIISQYRKQNNLPPYPPAWDKNYLTEVWSKVATIVQQPEDFDFPGRKSINSFHYCGLLINSELRDEIEFPWEKLNGKPIIYASLGTLQNSLDNIFATIAQACNSMDYQLVMALGKKNVRSSAVAVNNLPKGSILVSYAPQLKILEKASLCITHAGLNTVLECLSNGVPMIAIPIAHDQPGVAARIVWKGTGKMLKRNCSVSQLNKAIAEVLGNKSYLLNALKMQQKIQNLNGVRQAADIVERALGL